MTVPTVPGGQSGALAEIRMGVGMTRVAAIVGNGLLLHFAPGISGVTSFTGNKTMPAFEWEVGPVVERQVPRLRVQNPGVLGMTRQTIISETLFVRVFVAVNAFAMGDGRHPQISGRSGSGKRVLPVVGVHLLPVTQFALHGSVGAVQLPVLIVLELWGLPELGFIVTLFAAACQLAAMLIKMTVRAPGGEPLKGVGAGMGLEVLEHSGIADQFLSMTVVALYLCMGPPQGPAGLIVVEIGLSPFGQGIAVV